MTLNVQFIFLEFNTEYVYSFTEIQSVSIMPNSKRRRPDTKQMSSLEEEGDLESEEAVDTSQTDEDKRRVRRTLRDLHDKLLLCKDGWVSEVKR